MDTDLYNDAKGCPVRAGIGPPAVNADKLAQGLPRASGDRPLLLPGHCKLSTVAPCERG